MRITQISVRNAEMFALQHYCLVAPIQLMNCKYKSFRLLDAVYENAASQYKTVAHSDHEHTDATGV
jgi:hypothetical protein